MNSLSSNDSVSLLLALELFLLNLQRVLVRIILDGKECNYEQSCKNVKKFSKHIWDIIGNGWEWLEVRIIVVIDQRVDCIRIGKIIAQECEEHAAEANTNVDDAS